MHAEAAIGRTGLWFAVLIVSILVFMTAADSGFAAHAVIVGITAFALMAMSAARFDPLGKAQGFFKMPEGPSKYDDDVIRWGVIATMFWGMAGLLVGVFIASQLAFPQLNFEPYLNFGRVRPLHTSAVIFAFGGNALIATSFYVVQRTCRTQLAFQPGAYSVRCVARRLRRARAMRPAGSRRGGADGSAMRHPPCK